MTAQNSNIPGFKNFSPSERFEALVQYTTCEPQQLTPLKGNALPLKLANGMIENVIGQFELPLGVATNFIINQKDYLIPMAVEEPSVVAAASYMAKLARVEGGFSAKSDRPIMRAQIQVMGVKDLESSKSKVLENKADLIRLANVKDETLVNLGGGCEDVEVHTFPNTYAGPMLVLHLLVDVRDAMGANTVNTMAEHVAPMVEKLTGGKVRLRILSNLADKRLATAEVKIRAAQFSNDQYTGSEVVKGIIEASAFAEVDPYRAATHNKGIMNGIDPVVVATGNDWRAIEAGAHAFAASEGSYTSLSKWRCDPEGNLTGTITLPMAVGLVGGTTKTHPAAQAAIKLLGVKTASELGQVIAVVGLAQNLAALRALATEGIQRGHMELHAKNIAMQAGATGSAIEFVVQTMIGKHEITIDHARAILSKSK